MNIQAKLDMIKWCSYTYKDNGKKRDAEETKKFFDLEFSKLLFDNVFEIGNAQFDLLSFFDFSAIFNNFDNGITEVQSLILKFMAVKEVRGVDNLLEKMPRKIKFVFFRQLYWELKNKNNKPVWLSRIVFCLKEQEKLSFVNSMIEETPDDEILYLLENLYKNGNDQVLCGLMHNERIVDIAIRRIRAPFFYEIIENLKLPNSILEKRQEGLLNILNRYQEYDVKDIKETFCDLYFHDTFNNVFLDVKTIIDFANDDVVFRDKYLGEIYGYLCNLFEFLNNDVLDSSLMLSSILINQKVLAKSYEMAQKRFKELISESISHDVIKNITPRTLLSTSGKLVNFYNIENQTEVQRNVTMLVSTVPCSDNALDFKKIYYSELNGEIQKNRRSCSLINETKLHSLFGGKNRIIFGYEDLTGRVITSATLTDGVTDGNEVRFRKRRKVQKSSYSKIDKFIAETYGHNEITINMGETNEVMKPSYILITRENPTQFEIDVAAEFQIPIRYININKYEQVPNGTYNAASYDYIEFKKKDLNGLIKDRKLS